MEIISHDFRSTHRAHIQKELVETRLMEMVPSSRVHIWRRTGYLKFGYARSEYVRVRIPNGSRDIKSERIKKSCDRSKHSVERHPTAPYLLSSIDFWSYRKIETFE